MFPDSEIARKFQCKHTKTTAIVNCLGSDIKQEIINDLQSSGAFSLLIDWSAAKSRQLYPILVRYFDKKIGKVVTRLLSLVDIDQSSTGENIFNLLDKCLSDNALCWDNVISLSIDNENTMSGLNKGVAGFTLRKNSNIFVNGCTCHLCALVASKAAVNMPFKLKSSSLTSITM